ncbi:MAG: hypothetical protein QOJ65_528 [Fimbriimonadaceae bacterium]|nr:hypothetical protein [Fimbriimonadaceae bacterium]
MPEDVNPESQPVVPPPPIAPPQVQTDWSQPPTPAEAHYAGAGSYSGPATSGPLDALIPTKNPPALISYYCGVFALTVCFSPVLSPIAVWQGIKALKLVKQTPGLRGTTHAITGIVLGSIGFLVFVVGIIGLWMSAQPPETNYLK